MTDPYLSADWRAHYDAAVRRIEPDLEQNSRVATKAWLNRCRLDRLRDRAARSIMKRELDADERGRMPGTGTDA